MSHHTEVRLSATQELSFDFWYDPIRNRARVVFEGWSASQKGTLAFFKCNLTLQYSIIGKSSYYNSPQLQSSLLSKILILFQVRILSLKRVLWRREGNNFCEIVLWQNSVLWNIQDPPTVEDRLCKISMRLFFGTFWHSQPNALRLKLIEWNLIPPYPHLQFHLPIKPGGVSDLNMLNLIDEW